MMKLKPLITIASLLVGSLVVLSGRSAMAAPTRYEAEAGPATCDGLIESNHGGFSGTGFCNGTNAIGAAVQFTVNASASGTATLAIR